MILEYLSGPICKLAKKIGDTTDMNPETLVPFIKHHKIKNFKDFETYRIGRTSKEICNEIKVLQDTSAFNYRFSSMETNNE